MPASVFISRPGNLVYTIGGILPPPSPPLSEFVRSTTIVPVCPAILENVALDQHSLPILALEQIFYIVF